MKEGNGMECWILIRLKESLHDPQGQATLQVARKLGSERLRNVRVGRLVILEFPEGEQEEYKAEVERLARELLVNPLIEEYTIQWRS